ncbi:hypothetical protein SANTM175S_10723 [Streptomyces antimycoticus]
MAPLALPLTPLRTSRERDTHPAVALRLPAIASSVSTVRTAVRERLLARGMSAQVRDDALLVVSELVTNVITHTLSDHVECRLTSVGGSSAHRGRGRDPGPHPPRAAHPRPR